MSSTVPNDILGKLAARCPVLSPVVLAPGEHLPLPIAAAAAAAPPVQPQPRFI